MITFAVWRSAQFPSLSAHTCKWEFFLGVNAALHGNELNGISTIFKLIDEIDPTKLKGTLVLVPISNVPGYLANQRFFSDNVDLNRIMPGKAEGSSSNIYAHYLTSKIFEKFDYKI